MKSLGLVMVVLFAVAVQASFAFHWGEKLAPLSSYLPGSDPCSGVNCGNGTCSTTNVYPFVKCECNAGWKQPLSHHELPFQPCVIPNCTIDYNCSSSSSSMSSAAAPSPSQFKTWDNPFDPCNYEICGGGNCVAKSNTTTFEYGCECFQGYSNVMNWTWGFCAKECELKSDCSRIGISVGSNDSTSTTDNSSSYAHGGLKFMAENGGLVSGSILATLIVLLFK